MRPLVIIDGSNLARRAFHAGGGAGVLSAARKVRVKLGEEAEVVAAWDGPPPTWRHDLWKPYKAHRERNPEALEAVRREFREAAGGRVASILAEGGEADDAAATLATRAVQRGRPVWLVSSDKDWGQLVGPLVHWLVPEKGELLERGPEWFTERYGVPPRVWPDFVGLAGDPTDGIPGVRGIGTVKARELLQLHGSLEVALQLGDLRPEDCNLASISKRLAELKRDAKLSWH